MRRLSFKETANGLRSGSLAQTAKPRLILFFESACVKENRKLPLCKGSDGGSYPGPVRYLNRKISGETNGCGCPDFPGAIRPVSDNPNLSGRMLTKPGRPLNRRGS